jgi:integrase
MATIRKKGDLQWHVQVRKKGFPSVTKTFNTRADAEAWATVTESEMVRGMFQDRTEAEHTTIRDIINRFTMEFAPHHYRKRADQKEAWRYQCVHLKDRLGMYSLASLDQKLVAGYRDGRLKDVSESTVRKELYMLSKVLHFAETEAGITLPRGNPVFKIRKPADGRSRDRRLTKEEWTKFETECKSSRNVYLWPAVELAVETSMRQGELLGLRWEHIDMKRRLAFLEITKNGEARGVPFSSRAMKVLEGLPRSIQGNVLPVQRMTLYHVFHAAVVRAEIKDFTFHDLRHEALSRLAERGDFTVLELAAVSGHKTLQMLKRYTHLQAEKLAAKLG